MITLVCWNLLNNRFSIWNQPSNAEKLTLDLINEIIERMKLFNFIPIRFPPTHLVNEFSSSSNSHGRVPWTVDLMVLIQWITLFVNSELRAGVLGFGLRGWRSWETRQEILFSSFCSLAVEAPQASTPRWCTLHPSAIVSNHSEWNRVFVLIDCGMWSAFLAA